MAVSITRRTLLGFHHKPANIKYVELLKQIEVNGKKKTVIDEEKVNKLKEESFWLSK
jgi:hypothetical protein